MSRKHHPLWAPSAEDRAVAAALGPDAAWLVVPGGWGFVRAPRQPHEPRSAVLDLVLAVGERWPGQARGILRGRIRATAIAPFDADVVRVTAKRLSLVEAAPGPVEGALVDLGAQAERARARALELLGEGPGVTARLGGLVARNGRSVNPALHAEVALLLSWWTRERRGVPAGERIRVSLQCCRMCAALIVACAEGRVEVLYDRVDPGRFARGTALQRLGWESGKGAG